jgi:hypothetical protein
MRPGLLKRLVPPSCSAKRAKYRKKTKGVTSQQLTIDAACSWFKVVRQQFSLRYGHFSLRKIGQKAGGMNYATVAQAELRFAGSWNVNAGLRPTVTTIECQLSNV